jgi:hypothetical protein
MAKKKFASGIERLFLDDAEEVAIGGGYSEVSVQARPERRSSGTKSFASDLDSLLHEALEASLERYDDEQESGFVQAVKSKANQGAMPAPTSGLDALIRQTIDVQSYEQDEQTGVRRLTVAVDRAKLDKLKTIARLENANIKAILVELIDEYIQDYSKEKGLSI